MPNIKTLTYMRLYGTHDIYEFGLYSHPRIRNAPRPPNRAERGPHSNGLITVEYDRDIIDLNNRTYMRIHGVTEHRVRLADDGSNWEFMTEDEVKDAINKERARDMLPYLESNGELGDFLGLLLGGLERAVNILGSTDTAPVKREHAEQLKSDLNSIGSLLSKAKSERDFSEALCKLIPDNLLEVHYDDRARWRHTYHDTNPQRDDRHLVISRYVRPLVDYVDSLSKDEYGNPSAEKFAAHRKKWIEEYMEHEKFMEISEFCKCYTFGYGLHSWSESECARIAKVLDAHIKADAEAESESED